MNDTAKIGPGYRFGHITVIEKSAERKGTSIVWNCRCDCGTSMLMDTQKIKRGAVASCGCVPRLSPRAANLTGQQFGKLTALYPTNRREDQGSIVWVCRCECGKEREVTAFRLLNGKVRSCGCLVKPPVEDYVGKVFSQLTVLEYAGRVNRANRENFWRCRCTCGKETIVAQNDLESGTVTSCGCTIEDDVRIPDGSADALLKRSMRNVCKTNKSGFTGVFQDKRGTWIAYISFKNKRYWLGRFQTKEDAIQARRIGEEMRKNFQVWYSAEESQKV